MTPGQREASSVSIRVLGTSLLAVAALLGMACAPRPPPAVPAAGGQVAALESQDLVVGSGAVAAAGSRVTVHYTGWLYDATRADRRGAQFDSSRAAGQPFQFVLGAGQVISGWDQGVQGMKVGGRRMLTIPSAMAYGARGAGGVIAPHEPLVFVVDLLSVD